MKIFNTKDIREIDAYTIKHEPVTSTDLMERAANGCVTWITENLASDTSLTIFTGPGNNGGDGWVIARLLYDKGFQHVELYHLEINSIISPDAEINRMRLINQGKVKITYIRNPVDFPVLLAPTVIIDALFGSGLTRSLEGLSLSLVNHVNASGCRIISIDIPSGLFGENNKDNPPEGIINASDTLTFQFPKRSFFFAENEKFTGKWHIIPIGLHRDIMMEISTDFYFISTSFIQNKLRKRKVFSHKGLYGHALLIAGSYGMMGAAVLTARSCMRTGTGLLTTHVPAAGYPIIQSSVPESIFSIDSNDSYISKLPSLERFSAIGAGPGIGIGGVTVKMLEFLLMNCKVPLVLDADSINILADHPGLQELLPENSIITPHPGEFDRLIGTSGSGYERNQQQIEYSKKHKIIIVLKGAFSSITLPDGRCYFNSTGNPGMATAGSGDVLTGMILSLLAQAYLPEEAALVGVFLHGLAGDLAAGNTSEEALIASDIIDNIGNAYKKLTSHEKSVL